MNKMVTPELIAYMAGIIDGEGTIMVEYLKGRWTPRPRICFGMTDRAIGELFYDIFGGSFNAKKPSGLGKKVIWYWQITGWRAQDMCSLLYPYLIIKKAKALECIGVRLTTRSEAAKAKSAYRQRDKGGRYK